MRTGYSVSEDTSASGRRKSGRFSRWLVWILFIVGATFAGAFYLPLHTAYHRLIGEYQALANTSDTTAAKLRSESKELETARAELEGFRAAASKRRSRNDATATRLAELKEVVSSKLGKSLKSGATSLIEQEDGVVVAFAAKQAFADSEELNFQRTTITTFCNVAIAVKRHGAHELTIRIPATVSGAGKFEEQWLGAAELGIKAAKVLSSACRYPAEHITVAATLSLPEATGFELAIGSEVKAD